MRAAPLKPEGHAVQIVHVMRPYLSLLHRNRSDTSQLSTSSHHSNFSFHHRCPSVKIQSKWILQRFNNYLRHSNGQKGVLSSSGDFKFMFVTSLRKKLSTARTWVRKRKKKDGSAVLGLSASFSSLWAQSNKQILPGSCTAALPIRSLVSLVLTCGKHRSNFKEEWWAQTRKPKDHRPAATKWRVWRQKQQYAQQARGSVEIRAAHGASGRGNFSGKSNRVQGDVSHTRKKRSEICVLLGAISDS